MSKIKEWISRHSEAFITAIVIISIFGSIFLVKWINGPRGHHVLEKISDGEASYTVYLSEDEYDDLYYGASEYSEVTGGDLQRLLSRLWSILRDKRTMYDYGSN